MQRVTKQKRIIEQELGQYSSFFNAEELYQKISRRNSKIGIATVYRFLNHLAAEGKIHSYSCNRRTLYSSSKKNHCHFTCERCSERKHINLKKLDFLHQEVPGEICHFQIDISGICGDCLQRLSF